MYRLGFITEEVYESHVRRYSVPLVREEPQPLTKEQTKQQEELEKINRTMGMVASQWNEHQDRKWRLGWIKKAEELENEVPNAKQILAIAGEKVEIHG